MIDATTAAARRRQEAVQRHPPRDHRQRRLRLAARSGYPRSTTPRSSRISRPRTPGSRRAMAPQKDTDRRAVQGDARADQGSRQVGPAEGRRLALLDRVRGRRRVQEVVAQAGRRRPRRADPRRGRRWPRARNTSASARSSVSNDGRRLAYSIDDNGSERFTARIKDLATGELLPDEIPGTLSALIWVAGDTGPRLLPRQRAVAHRQRAAALARQAARAGRRALPRGRRGLPRRRRAVGQREVADPLDLRPRDQRGPPDPRRRSAGRAAAGQAAREGRRVRSR